jgi:histidinol-phosphate/aromatic aminotransferase/cobyric acid decarboxylase-like protein
LACEGVRHALKTLFTLFAQEGERVAIPADVYPVYGRLAHDAGMASVAFPMFPHFDLRAILAGADAAGARHVLLPCPLKLHGRAWSEEEISIAEGWLARNSTHRLILDAVYGFGAPMDAISRRLTQTDQVIYLDSLSKGYLHAGVFGAAVVPERDVARFTTAFRALAPDLEKLATASELILRTSQALPARVVQTLAAKRAHLLTQLAHLPFPLQLVTHGYLVPINAPAEELRARHSILTIPASVFGSANPNWSLASCL